MSSCPVILAADQPYSLSSQPPPGGDSDKTVNLTARYRTRSRSAKTIRSTKSNPGIAGGTQPPFWKMRYVATFSQAQGEVACQIGWENSKRS